MKVEEKLVQKSNHEIWGWGRREKGGILKKFVVLQMPVKTQTKGGLILKETKLMSVVLSEASYNLEPYGLSKCSFKTT